jgi:hypothetical protein
MYYTVALVHIGYGNMRFAAVCISYYHFVAI